MSYCSSRTLLGTALAGVVAAGSLVAAEQPKLTEEQKRRFLLTAKVIRSRPIGRGVTSPWRLTLSDGTLSHDAAFQSIDEVYELNFRDSYHFNIAVYELAQLLSLTDMIPVTVERKWDGKSGALSWWIAFKWHESDRVQQKLRAPDPQAWSRQVYKMRVFSQLVYDTDRTVDNLLITEVAEVACYEGGFGGGFGAGSPPECGSPGPALGDRDE